MLLSRRPAWLTAALALFATCGVASAQMKNETLSDPEGDAMALRLIPIYETLAHNRLFSMPEKPSTGQGRAITDLTRDDVCGCYYAEGGGAVNAEQCEPIRKTQNDGVARLGVIRMIDYDTVRRALLPNANSTKEMSVTSALGRVARNERFRLDLKMQQALGDPHLMLLAPLPVAHRLMGFQVARPEPAKRLWEMCDLSVGDGAFAPPEVLSGFVARSMLYGAKKYGITVGFPLGTLERISSANPPGSWETARNVLIGRYIKPYGTNPFIPVPQIADKNRKMR